MRNFKKMDPQLIISHLRTVRSLCYSYDEGIPAHLFQMELYEETGLTLAGNHVLSLPELIQALSPAFELNFIWLRPTVQGYYLMACRPLHFLS